MIRVKLYIITVCLLLSFSCVSQRKEFASQSTIRLKGYNTNIRKFLDIDGYYTASYANLMFFEDGIYQWGGYWGVYKIERDTIIGNFFWKGGIFSSILICEERYKIINRKTVQKIYMQSLRKSDAFLYKGNYRSPWLQNEELHLFVPADSLPSSDCWLKEEKWIWLNEQDWKNYMGKIKKRNK